MHFIEIFLGHLSHSGDLSLWVRQTTCAVMMTKKGSTKIVNFMTPNVGVLVLGRGDISENALFLKKSSSLLPGIDQTNYVYSIDDQGRVYQNCKFQYPRGWNSDVRVWPYKPL